jgi:hypothetical protein
MIIITRFWVNHNFHFHDTPSVHLHDREYDLPLVNLNLFPRVQRNVPKPVDN